MRQQPKVHSDSFWADLANALALRPVYREPLHQPIELSGNPVASTVATAEVTLEDSAQRPANGAQTTASDERVGSAEHPLDGATSHLPEQQKAAEPRIQPPVKGPELLVAEQQQEGSTVGIRDRIRTASHASPLSLYRWMRRNPSTRKATRAGISNLQKRVATGLSKGLSEREIARSTGMDIKTVRVVIQNMVTKTDTTKQAGVRTRLKKFFGLDVRSGSLQNVVEIYADPLGPALPPKMVPSVPESHPDHPNNYPKPGGRGSRIGSKSDQETSSSNPKPGSSGS